MFCTRARMSPNDFKALTRMERDAFIEVLNAQGGQ